MAYRAIELTPSLADLDALQAEAARDGRECVVGGLIVNRRKEIFVQKRSLDRSLFPGCWDIAGGHVEPGENLYTALTREIAEETGWQLSQIHDLVATFDWETDQHGQRVKKREFDFLVSVQGDLNRPQIESDKFSAFRWVNEASLALLLENRAEGDDVIYHLVKQALEKANKNP